MSTQYSIYKICSLVGNYRTLLLGRPAIVCYQQSVGLKQSLEEKIGLPEKPKRPMTPYFRFMAEVRPALMKNNPNVKVTDIAKMVGQQWEKVNPATKQQFEVAYQKEKEAYDQALDKYKKKLTNEDRMKLQDAKRQILEKQEKAKLKLKVKELGKPKKPPTGYLCYANEKLAQRGGTNILEWRKKSAEDWKALPEKEKEAYLKRQKMAMDAYKHDLSKWEERMIRMGNIELVRNEALMENRPVPKKKPSSNN